MKKLLLITFTFFSILVARVGVMALPLGDDSSGIRASTASPIALSGETTEKVALVAFGMGLFSFAAFLRRRIAEPASAPAAGVEAPEAVSLAAVSHQ